MSSEITIVTGFYRLNRSEWKGFSRSDDQYFQYFKGWSSLKNKIVVYVETEDLRDKIIEWRSSIGLGDKTIVNVIKDFTALDKPLYDSIVKATDNPIQQSYRLKPGNPDACKADYNYFVTIKTLLVCDAVKRKQAEGMIAWLDFGYNHGWETYTKESDFNYTWEYDFPDKINLTTIQALDDRPIFDISIGMDSYFMAGSIIAPDYLWDEFWKLMREACIELNDCGISDDEQTQMIMAYRKKPELFKVWMSSWTYQLYQFGGEKHLILVQDNASTAKKALRSLWHKFQHRKLCLKQAVRTYRHLSKYYPR